MRLPRTELNLTEWIVLARSSQAPIHGWQIVRELRRGGLLGQLWTTSGPLVYRAITMLQEAGLLVATGKESGDGPSRVMLLATDEGRRRVDAWFEEPVEHVRDVRTTLLVKLLLLEWRGGSRRALVARQRSVMLPLVAALRDQATAASGDERLIAIWRALNAEGVVRFLDAIDDDGSGAAAPA